MKDEVKRDLYYQIKAVLSSISKFGEADFLRNLRESKLKIPRKDCSELKDNEIEELITNIIRTNLHPAQSQVSREQRR